MGSQGLKDAYKNCPQCKKMFYIPSIQEWGYRAEDKKKRTDYCSWGCKRAAEREKQEKEVIRYCKYCGKVLSGKNKKYCDIICSEGYNAKKAQKRSQEKRTERRRLKKLQAVC